MHFASVLNRKLLLQVNVIPLSENDLREGLAQAGVYFQVTEQAVIKLRYQVSSDPRHLALAKRSLRQAV